MGAYEGLPCLGGYPDSWLYAVVIEVAGFEDVVSEVGAYFAFVGMGVVFPFGSEFSGWGREEGLDFPDAICGLNEGVHLPVPYGPERMRLQKREVAGCLGDGF